MSTSQLPLFAIYIHPNDLRELRRDIWNDEPVPATLTFHKKKFHIDISYRGSHIRKFKKKSYFISFYKPYLFHGAHELHLNSEYKDPSLMRNKLSLDFFSDLGVLSPSSRHVLLSINGKHEGIYLQLESVDEFFLKKRQLPLGPIFYAIDDDANFSLIGSFDEAPKTYLDAGYERKLGTREDHRYLEEFIFKLNTTPKYEYESVMSKILDVNKYLRWLAGVVCTQNFDGFVHNYALYRNPDSGLFEIIPWDFDATWGRDINGKQMDYDYVRIEGFNTLTARLLDIERFRKMYYDIMKHTLDHEFTVEFMKPKVEKLYQQLRPHVVNDPYIKDRIEQFDGEPEWICEFIEKRNAYLKNQLSTLL
jgi:spore coat protein H